MMQVVLLRYGSVNRGIMQTWYQISMHQSLNDDNKEVMIIVVIKIMKKSSKMILQ